MKISLKWIADYVDISEAFADPQVLVEKLTHAGLEVEDVQDLGKSFNHVVIGHILEKGTHPGADRLSLCQVTTGPGTVHQIVCGATNHQQGDKVVVALPGAVLPGNFVIKKSKIRGVESNGMLCSESELGVADDSAGIMILPAEARVGESFADAQGLNDVLMELSVTPNRADCLSHIGLAREIAALLDRKFELPKKSFAESQASTKECIRLEVHDPDRCPRYAGRSIRGVQVGPSPVWLKRRLEAIGLNSINNIVDITNYVMMEMGQPLHAFDAALLVDSKITVECARAGEKFITLDGSEVTLSGEELTIRDGEKAVALAGVVGGVHSGVTDETREIFLEAAYFTAACVRKTSRQLGIETDSAYRFSRGVDPEGVVLALNRACQLIQEIAGGEVLGAAYDLYPRPVQREPIDVDIDFITQKLGYTVRVEEFTAWMQRLGCQVSVNGAELKVQAPAFRWDLNQAVDLVEEYARVNGYEHIPETLPAPSSAPAAHHQDYLSEVRVHSWAQSLGYRQVVNHSFIASELTSKVLGDLEKLKPAGLECTDQPVRLLNPLSEELDMMRISLMPGLVKNLAHNDRYGNHHGRLYEVGCVFAKEATGYRQERRLAWAAWGAAPGLWRGDEPLVLRLKADLEIFLAHLRSRSWRWDQFEFAATPDFLHPGQAAQLFYEGQKVGLIGGVHPRLARDFKIRSECILAEFDLDKLMRGQPRVPKSRAPSKFPSVGRDLAFVMPEDLSVGRVMAEMKRAAGAVLSDVHVFDVYRGDGLPRGQRSVAFRLSYQGAEATLSEQRILELQERVMNSVGQKFSISVR